MLATVINVALVLVGSAVGLIFKNLISEKLMSLLTQALGLCVLGVGVCSLVGTENILCVVVCMAVGSVIGHAVDIEGRLERGGDLLRAKVVRRGEGRGFTESFVNASLLFCVGAMAITGSIEAGMNHNYEILVSKGIIDGVMSVSFAATMGVGVAFSAVPLFLYQGVLTLLAAWVGPLLPQTVITEMSAVGGTLIVAVAINMLGLGKEKIKVGNMLPAMFLPIAYIPLANWLGGLF
ncbi:MAG: DUF554 domain-containing protein [Candidatus Enterenecus sp.]